MGLDGRELAVLPACVLAAPTCDPSDRLPQIDGWMMSGGSEPTGVVSVLLQVVEGCVRPVVDSLAPTVPPLFRVHWRVVYAGELTGRSW